MNYPVFSHALDVPEKGPGLHLADREETQSTEQRKEPVILQQMQHVWLFDKITSIPSSWPKATEDEQLFLPGESWEIGTQWAREWYFAVVMLLWSWWLPTFSGDGDCFTGIHQTHASNQRESMSVCNSEIEFCKIPHLGFSFISVVFSISHENVNANEDECKCKFKWEWLPINLIEMRRNAKNRHHFYRVKKIGALMPKPQS